MRPRDVLRAAAAILRGMAFALLLLGMGWYFVHLIARWIGNP